VLSLVLPVLAVVIIFSATGKSRSRWLVRNVVGVLLMIFCYQAAIWAAYSVYLKYVFVVFTLAALVWSVVCPVRKTKRISPVGIMLCVLVSIPLIIGNVMALRSHQSPSDEMMDLQFPLRNGTYYILQGGNSRLTNFFHGRWHWQELALDIVKLDKWGRRASGLLPSDVARYAIYADTVYSPCSGTVAFDVDGQPEAVPPRMPRQGTLGNAIGIDNGKGLVVMAHLKPGSVMVRKGQRVVTGQPVGLVGNSGRSAEPHLHIMALTYLKGDAVRGTALPMRFDGKFLTLNDVVVN